MFPHTQLRVWGMILFLYKYNKKGLSKDFSKRETNELERMIEEYKYKYDRGIFK